jgi:hypothetical protein
VLDDEIVDIPGSEHEEGRDGDIGVLKPWTTYVARFTHRCNGG